MTGLLKPRLAQWSSFDKPGSPSFTPRFGRVSEIELFRHVASYCGAQRAGKLGEAEIALSGTTRKRHLFRFETIFNSYEALTLAVWQRPAAIILGLRQLDATQNLNDRKSTKSH
jgi:hypothetical protein